jgi:proton-translocating NADH-quinone oxidoreductase chain L
MTDDPHLPKFMSYISLFTFFMLMLVTANNFLQLFLGWEGVGLCSFLLISFWHTRIQANKAAIKAMVVNRIGDFGLLFGILLIFDVFKTIEFHSVFALAPYFYKKYFMFLGLNLNILTTVGFLLFIGAMGKSAQIGLHTWLPDAMEGPTPVSALIHAATMVTAGVFLIIRCSPLFEYTPSILTLITSVGAITAFFAASIGLVQNDIKKIIAYSTCSQLGYMIFACGLSGYSVGLFHLFNHAFFKALLFLSAGSIIHGLANEQDLRKMGGLLQGMSFTYINFVIGSLALMGFPFLAGFYSKDVILEIAYAKYAVTGTFSH